MCYGLSDVSKTQIAADLGVATGGTNVTLLDTSRSWQVNQWAAGFIVEILKPLTGVRYFAPITANTVNQLTFAALPVGVAAATGDIYYIREAGSLADLAQFIRWGRAVAPTWVHAAEQVAPGAATVLVTQAVTAGMVGYAYGFFISVGEANDFLLNWTSATVAYTKRMVFGAGGTVETLDQLPLNEGLPADAGSAVTITNVNAGGVGIIYQACLLYAEV